MTVRGRREPDAHLLDPPPDLTGTRDIAGAAELRRLSGTWIGRSPWVRVDRDAVAAFRRATGSEDSDWVSDDHLLALAGGLVPRVCRVRGRRHGVNYGLDRVVFGDRLPIGCRLRAAVQLRRADECDGHVDAHWYVVAETGGPGRIRPLVTATMITRYVF